MTGSSKYDAIPPQSEVQQDQVELDLTKVISIIPCTGFGYIVQQTYGTKVWACETLESVVSLLRDAQVRRIKNNKQGQAGNNQDSQADQTQYPPRHAYPTYPYDQPYPYEQETTEASKTTEAPKTTESPTAPEPSPDHMDLEGGNDKFIPSYPYKY